MRPDLIMKSILPVVMAGVLGIYGIIMSIIISGKMSPAASYSSYLGYTHLASGLIVGLSSLAAGLAIGIVGDAGVRANAQQNRLFIGMILILVFSETLALY
ncbi:V-type proton ATPase 16 kDa proteolipid subunit, putative, partial [Plasmodium ovale curtisi]